MNLITVFQKELQSHFKSPLAHIVVGVFWLIAGFYLVEILLGEQGIIQQVTFSDNNSLNTQQINIEVIFF
jgi:ABC-2 type transport system permease protein